VVSQSSTSDKCSSHVTSDTRAAWRYFQGADITVMTIIRTAEFAADGHPSGLLYTNDVWIPIGWMTNIAYTTSTHVLTMTHMGIADLTQFVHFGM
jgi:hypothetical protein